MEQNEEGSFELEFKGIGIIINLTTNSYMCSLWKLQRVPQGRPKLQT